MIVLNELYIGCLFSQVKHLIMASIADSDTKGFDTLMLLSKARNHWGNDENPSFGRCI